MIDDLFVQFEGAFAGNTIRAYRADFNRFSRWSCEEGIDPLDARPEDLAAYIKWRMPTSSSGSIERAVWHDLSPQRSGGYHQNLSRRVGHEKHVPTEGAGTEAGNTPNARCAISLVGRMWSG